MGRKRTCELPFCHGVVEGTRNKRRCDKDRNIHLHQVISKNVRKIMRYVEGCQDFTANDVNRDLFKGRLDKNEKGSMYRLFQAMVREGYLSEHGKREGLKVYSCALLPEARKSALPDPDQAPAPVSPAPAPVAVAPTHYPEATLSPRDKLVAKLREFVHLKQGAWNHEDWLWLINRPDILELGFSHADIGSLLETEKAGFWKTR